MPTELVLPAAVAAAVGCVPPPGFRNTPPPTPAPLEQLIARTEEVVIARPMAVVLASDAVPLEQAVQSGGDLPRVIGTHNLTPGFDGPGSRRMVCLSDGSTLLEQVLVREAAPTSARFRYVVWNYTSPTARPIQYAVGEFRRTERADGTTHVRWTYAFRLRGDRFPGALGPVGAWLFRVSFLDRSYAAMMRGSLAGMKARAEAWRGD
jgi:hypothetical protein